MPTKVSSRASVGSPSAFVFQFYNIIPSLTALENVRLVTDIADDPMDPKAALDLVGLGDRMNHFPSQLSGGEQQRVAIARAVAKQPDVLLCDEPTGALDFSTGVLVLEVIERVHQELDTTVALITHNAGIADMADRGDPHAQWRDHGGHDQHRPQTTARPILVGGRLQALTTKLFREIGHLRGQLIAIVVVIACGIANFVTFRAVHSSLTLTQQSFYEDSRFADVFLTARRVPESVKDRICCDRRRHGC